MTALLTLAVGIGVNTSMFSVMNATILRELPYGDPSRLVRVYRTTPQSQAWPHAPANFLDYRAQNTVFEGMAAVNWRTYNLSHEGQPPERMRCMVVTGDYFALLGVAPLLGRTFGVDEDRPGHDRVIVLTHRGWLNRFAGDRSIVGRSIRVDGEPATVLGVMPPAFDEPLLWGSFDGWRPMAWSETTKQSRDNHHLDVIARLKPGVTLPQAQAAMSSFAARIAELHPQTNTQSGLRLLPLNHSRQDDAGRRLTWFVVGLAFFVLLIACANLANLQVARTSRRARELAVRAALGASRVRLVGLLLNETVLLGIVGGAAGLLLALWGNDLLSRQIVIGDVPGLALPLDWRVLGFTLITAVGSGFAFGLLPAWICSRANVGEALKQGGRTASPSQHRLRSGLVVAEVALALVLLCGAGFFARGLHGFSARDLGWRPEGLMAGFLSLSAKTHPEGSQRAAFLERVEARVARIPGIESVAVARTLPISGFSQSGSFMVEGRPRPTVGDAPLSYLNPVSPSYFRTTGMRLLQGRLFTAADTSDKPAVAIINESMARTLFGSENPIGRRIGNVDELHPNWREIVGVVADVGFAANPTPRDTTFQTYRPLAQVGGGWFATLVVRTHLDPAAFTSAVRRAVAELDPDQPVHGIMPLAHAIDRELANLRIIGGLLAGFAFLGVALAAIGIYGVLAAHVSERRREIGVRVALGAQLADILRLILAQGMKLALYGIVIGGVGAWGVARLLQSMLPGLAAPDLGTAGVITGVLLLTAALACWLPAFAAARLKPTAALRED